ncbi:MAG: chromate transporter, partial [Burkholderiales bacterium]|nr:chromate transporter [Opitutaceae bacterium]
AGGHGGGKAKTGGAGAAVIDDHIVVRDEHRPTLGGALRTSAAGLSLWALPLVAIGLWLGVEHVLFREGVFFSKAAVVTFGGAYAVLPYVAQQAVETHGWLTASQMLDGLGLAETTPGPLILVLQFVGFVGAWGEPAPFAPLTAATLGAGITLWCTFVPSFLFVFLGAPWIEALRGQRLVTCALSTITAAVVGVVLNLAVWFALGVLFPGGGATDWFAVVTSIAVFIGLIRFKWEVVPVILGCAALGVAWRLLV